MIDRTAFLYMEPDERTPRPNKFAQCSTCHMWSGPKSERCSIHGPDLQITGQMSCGLYVHDKDAPHPEMADMAQTLVKPQQSGLVRAAVRCENCRFYQGTGTAGLCGLFMELNAITPRVARINVNVKAKGCCNAWDPPPEDGDPDDYALVEMAGAWD